MNDASWHQILWVLPLVLFDQTLPTAIIKERQRKRPQEEKSVAYPFYVCWRFLPKPKWAPAAIQLLQNEFAEQRLTSISSNHSNMCNEILVAAGWPLDLWSVVFSVKHMQDVVCSLANYTLALHTLSLWQNILSFSKKNTAVLYKVNSHCNKII